ncbi:ATP-binding cassette domain-containing protein [Streptomyces sp. B1866]|uniref:ABC transporter ATP-binding protein n=1 Tax=Streptomyces sp. B1866 TaxID=3075431 RepID=UPI002891882E|nr:ATP-binding cassette domain-containing protein [Streptomyces sp. B1866]MDT3400389.1 ATP-binding cassette domain-containing protein [Streptomyces sp. B1866]
MRLRGVGRRYGLRGPWVLRRVDLDVPPRSLIRVEGANGSGKSTLLRLVAGIDAPSAGRVTGRPRTAYVPERFPADLPFTALGYLVHLGRAHGLRTAVARRRAEEWLERFGAGGHARTPLAELSKGTSQKVAVAQALLAGPGLLVLDEAWTGLDQGARGVLDQAVAERVADGGTVVFVDHDPGRLAGAADAVYRVAAGGLTRVPSEPAADAADAAARARTGPRVRVEVQGPPGAALPADLPGAPLVEEVPYGPYEATGRPPGRGADAAGRRIRLTVAAAYSDVLLRALLTARPPWHVHAVAAVAQAPPPGSPAAGALPRGCPPARDDASPDASSHARLPEAP